MMPIDVDALGPDPDLLAELDSLVAVAIDANFDGSVLTPLGAVNNNWQPVGGLAVVPCYIERDYDADRDLDARPGVIANHTLVFGAPIALDRRHRLEVLDPLTGLSKSPPEYLFCVGTVDDACRKRHHWTIRAVQFKV